MRIIRNEFKNSATRRGLYCVWLEARERGTARLVSVWIDPAMQMFEPNTNEHSREELNMYSEISLPVLDDEPPSRTNVLDDEIRIRLRNFNDCCALISSPDLFLAYC